MATRNLRVLYFGGYRPEYARHKFYAQALKALGVEVLEGCVSYKLPTLKRIWALVVDYWRNRYQSDVIYVEEFNHSIIPFAWLLARLTGQALAFDPGVSNYDELVNNAKTVAANSLYARYLWLNNWLAFRLPDLVVWFTPVDMEYFGQMFGIPLENNDWIAPGVDLAHYHLIPMPPIQKPLVIHFDGNISPTHGVDVVLRAAALLPQDEFVFEIIGEGIVDELRALATELHLTNVKFPGFVSNEELAASMERAHICLGAFRADDKLRRSLYTKEIQAMLCGRPVVTGWGEAKARWFRDGEDLLMIEPENPQALANAFLQLRDHPDRLLRMANNSYEAGCKLLAPENTSKKLVNLLSKVVNRRRGVVGQNPTPPL